MFQTVTLSGDESCGGHRHKYTPSLHGVMVITALILDLMIENKATVNLSSDCRIKSYEDDYGDHYGGLHLPYLRI